jgi:membrane associated rhomboid family serine protease
MVAPTPPRRSISRILPSPVRPAALSMLLLTGLLYAVEVADVVSGQTLERAGGIVPREVDGLDGLAFAPLLHGSWAHLLGNTVPFLVLGFLAMAGGVRQFLPVTALIWVGGGAAVWLTADSGTYHVGASGVIFGWLAFLLTRGFFARSLKQIGLAVVLFLVWGGILLGVLPGQQGIAWQGHLFGALSGVLGAWLVARADRPSVRA